MATDFSSAANEAAKVALALGRRMDSGVDLIHVMSPGPQPLTGYAILDELLSLGASREDLR